MDLSNRIKIIRGSLTQSKFAAEFGLHVATLQRYEKGDRIPDATFLGAVCEKCNVSPSWLLTGEGPMYRERSDQAGGPDAERREALGLSEEGSKLLDLYFDLPRDLRKKFIAGMRMMLDLDRHGKDEKIKELLDLIEKSG